LPQPPPQGFTAPLLGIHRPLLSRPSLPLSLSPSHLSQLLLAFAWRRVGGQPAKKTQTAFHCSLELMIAAIILFPRTHSCGCFVIRVRESRAPGSRSVFVILIGCKSHRAGKLTGGCQGGKDSPGASRGRFEKKRALHCWSLPLLGNPGLFFAARSDGTGGPFER
jgi:hypothetical protein